MVGVADTGCDVGVEIRYVSVDDSIFESGVLPFDFPCEGVEPVQPVVGLPPKMEMEVAVGWCLCLLEVALEKGEPKERAAALSWHRLPRHCLEEA